MNRVRYGQSPIGLAGSDWQIIIKWTYDIVIHAATYVSANMVRDHGKLGRSEGCLAVGTGDIDHVLNRLGHGRMIYVDKIT